MKLVNLLARAPRSVVTALALLLCVVVGVSDWLNGHDYTLVPFYLVPVILAAWGRRTGYLISCVSVLAWLIAEMARRHYYRLNFALLLERLHGTPALYVPRDTLT